MVILTGDTHGNFKHIHEFCKEKNTTSDDVMVVLGDVGFNYHFNSMDEFNKKHANKQPITWFCIKGNHEKYAGEIDTYEEVEAFGGKVYVETEYPNILFAKDGEVYTFNINGVKKKVLVIGGAYSVDKFRRAVFNQRWFHDEQPSDEVKRIVESKIEQLQGEIDYVFSHTAPLRYEPTEHFLDFIEQDSIDKSTEKWLDKIYDMLKIEKWYCGHYHCSKSIDNLRILYNEFIMLGK